MFLTQTAGASFWARDENLSLFVFSSLFYHISEYEKQFVAAKNGTWARKARDGHNIVIILVLIWEAALLPGVSCCCQARQYYTHHHAGWPIWGQNKRGDRHVNYKRITSVNSSKFTWAKLSMSRYGWILFPKNCFTAIDQTDNDGAINTNTLSMWFKELSPIMCIGHCLVGLMELLFRAL